MMIRIDYKVAKFKLIYVKRVLLYGWLFDFRIVYIYKKLTRQDIKDVKGWYHED